MKLAVLAVLALGIVGSGAAQAQDAAQGESVFNRCKGCHMVGEGAQNKAGPMLNDLFGRTAGTLPDYKYSQAMVDAGAGGLVWDHDTLTQFLAAPRDFVKGTKMAFGGIKNETELANLVAYLQTFSPNYTAPAQ